VIVALSLCRSSFPHVIADGVTCIWSGLRGGGSLIRCLWWSYPPAEILRLEDGRTVEWEAVGDGPPLMWVEDGPGFWAHLARPDAELVSDLFRCHLVNPPGCGHTSPPATSPGTTCRIIACFNEVRERLGIGQVTVMGQSLGGLVAAA
jgi:pimeloyl-ACP methyl ester carboxylesterase